MYTRRAQPKSETPTPEEVEVGGIFLDDDGKYSTEPLK